MKHGLIHTNLISIQLLGCQLCHENPEKNCSGVAVYIANCIAFKIIDSLTCAVNNVLECISVKLHIANNIPIIVGCLHRLPDIKISQSLDIIVNLF